MTKTDEKEMFLELIDEIIKTKPNKTQLNNIKTAFSKKYSLGRIVKNTQIIANSTNDTRQKVIDILNIKPVRELSGVTVVALFAKPHSCPHGRCIYCPGGIKSEFGDTPQSYTGAEPAALRAIRNEYDPYLQVFNRLEHYVVNGHKPDKIELIFMGGTFPHLDKKYKDEFVNFVYKAINDFGDEFVFIDDKGMKHIDYDKFNEFFETKDDDFKSETRETNILAKVLLLKNNNLKDYKYEIKKNETANLRSIGLTIETKPDYALKEHCSEMLEYGCTRLEIGVQTLDETVLKKVNRGHTIDDTKEAFRIAKDMCFKINAHMMVGLPFSNLENDKKALVNLFKDEDYRPDMLKIYPCLVTKGTPLYDMFLKGEFKAYDTIKIAEVIAEAFKDFPRYVRVMRVQRDIPTQNIEGGVKNSNLREFVDKEMINKGIKSSDIRAREIGLKEYKYGASSIESDSFHINVEEYMASGGKEFFIDVINKEDYMIGFIRLRFPKSFNLINEIKEGTALIRELHVYGSVKAVGDKKGDKHQHKGWGKKLLLEAERIAKENGYTKMAIISGIGVREYYRKFGYELEGGYMVKRL